MYFKMIQKKGLKANLPTLDVGEFGFCTDTKELFIGHSSGNIRIGTKDEIEKRGIDITLAGADPTGVAESSTAIQNVLNLAKTVGGVKVFAPKGLYKMTARIAIYSNTVFKSDKNATFRRDFMGTFLINGDQGDIFTGYNGYSNIVIDGGTWDGNLTGSYANNTGNGFGFARGKNLVVKNITMKDIGFSHCLDINSFKGVLVKDCRFLGYKDTSGDGSRDYCEAVQISPHNYAGFNPIGNYDGTPCVDVTVRDCYFGASDTQPAWATGVGGHGSTHDKFCDNIVVEGCTFDGCTYAGVRPFKYTNVRITNNHFRNCKSGVIVSSAYGNSSSSYTGTALDADKVQTGLSQSGWNYVIDGNTFEGINDEVMFISGGYQDSLSEYSTVKNVLITNNIIRDHNGLTNDKAVFSLRLIKDIKITDNILIDTHRAVYMQYVSDVHIKNNTFRTITYEAIFNSEPIAGLVGLGLTKNVYIVNNDFWTTTRSAILIQRYDGFEITGNRVHDSSTETDNTRSAIRVEDTSKNGKVVNNKVTKGTGNQNKYGIEVTSGCLNVQVFNNDVEGKTGRQSVNSSAGWDGFYAHSPDGTRYKITVANGGTISIVAG